MATYFQGLSDNAGAVPFAKLDYNYLNQVTKEKDQQYQQGLDETKSDYSAILNAPVTGEAANKVKNQYISNAQESLKKISAADLSLPQNVQQAEAVFAPFWKDSALLMNIAGTKQQQSYLSEGNSYKDSTDKDKRALYDPDAMEYMQRGLKALGELPFSEQAYSKWNARPFIPVHNIDAEVDAAYKAEEQKGVGFEDANGAGIVATKNGPRSREAFRVYYMSKIGDRYDAQINMKANLQMERDIDGIKYRHPELDERAVRNQLGIEYADQYANYIKGGITSNLAVANEYAQQIKKLSPVNGSAKMDPALEQNLTMLLEKEKEAREESQKWADKGVNEMGFSYDKEKWNTHGVFEGGIDYKSPTYLKKLNDLQEHPQDYIGSIHKNQLADNWAAGMAALSSVQIKKNEQWDNFMDHAEKKAELIQNQQKIDQLGNHYENEDMARMIKLFGPEYAKKTYGETAVTEYMNNPGGGTGTPSLGSGDIQQGDITNVQEVSHPLDSYTRAQQDLFNGITGKVYDFDGVSGLVLNQRVLGDKGLTDDEIMNLNKWSRKALNGQEGTPAEEAAVAKAKGILVDNGLVKGGDRVGPKAMIPLLNQMIPKVQKFYSESSTPGDMDKFNALADAYGDITHSLATYNTNEEQYKAAVNRELANDKRFTKLLNPQTGKRWTAEEMAAQKTPEGLPIFPKLNVEDDKGKELTISSQELAGSYRNGDFGYNSNKGKVYIGGKEYKLNGIDDKTADAYATWKNPLTKLPFGNDKNQAAISDLENRLGLNANFWKGGVQIAGAGPLGDQKKNPQQLINAKPGSAVDKFGYWKTLPELDRLAGDKVLSQLTGFKKGLVGAIAGYDPNSTNKSQAATATRLVQEAVMPDNALRYYYKKSNGETVDLSDDERRLVQNLVGEKDIQKTVARAEVHPTGPDGIPAVSVKFSDYKPSDKTEVASEKLVDLMNKGEIYMNISSKAGGQLLQTLPKRHDVFAYGQLLDGKPVESDAISNSMGFSYKIIPDRQGTDGRYNTARIFITKQELDADGNVVMDQHNKPKLINESIPINLMDGANAKSPDELVQGVYALRSSYFNQRKANKMNYLQQQQAGSPVGTRSFNDLLKQYNGTHY